MAHKAAAPQRRSPALAASPHSCRRLWPIIAVGHSYGLDYPGASWLGMLTMIWFKVVAGVFLGWVTLRGSSVWPAAIGHAALNGIAGLPTLFGQGSSNPLLGPMAVGLVGSAAWAVVVFAILWRLGALNVAAGDWPATQYQAHPGL